MVASAKQPAVKAQNDDIQRGVNKSFQDRADLKDVDIAVKNCVARLTGTVPNGPQRLEAAVVACSTVGVCSVQDDLRIADRPGTRHACIERFGESHPVASHDTTDGRAQNTRVELRVE